ncbi:HopJ type III effector protein [Gillisia limnaea]|uniref:HopJ type III effector protein n=1 Tax=Gillisia limnaea (strain DSM 15749 / LMG 21470 / R-8282) TaxID=865937 RepID=H2BTP8_GILLR|nr:HopJ type III effector protein [Gillisia limnaea]EHQ02668.1 HopJ type III effector protein [Gillisia limnaea DSM 15749]
MDTSQFITALKQDPKANEFSRTIEVIDDHYKFTPSAFTNGDLNNTTGENTGSCKIFAFAKLQGLSEYFTLACFGKYYFEDVLENPDEDNHRNIRNFTKTGWNGIQFKGNPLEEK